MKISSHHPVYQSARKLSPRSPEEGPKDSFTPSTESKVKKTLIGIGVGAGVATVACLAVAGTINPLGAIVIFCSGVVGGTYAHNDGNIEPPDPFDPFNPYL